MKFVNCGTDFYDDVEVIFPWTDTFDAETKRQLLGRLQEVIAALVRVDDELTLVDRKAFADWKVQQGSTDSMVYSSFDEFVARALEKDRVVALIMRR
ncbi:MAG: hypothetical protein DRJ38_00405 [Thermoprotei archaeon]|nr:MAG: hypothetical protein DRJ38_00405 [Thermoprotei archaeon]